MIKIKVFITNEGDTECNQLRPTNLLLGLKQPGLQSLPRILKLIDAYKGKVDHIESRRKHLTESDQDHQDVSEGHYELFISMNTTRMSLLNLIKALRHGNLADLTILKEQLISIKGRWIILSIYLFT